MRRRTLGYGGSVQRVQRSVGSGGASLCREGFPLACLRRAFGTLLHLTTPLAPLYFVRGTVVRVFTPVIRLW